MTRTIFPRGGRGLPLASGALSLLLLVGGCPGATPGTGLDFDGDGWDDEDDCGPEDPAVHPGADDPFGDGVDADCDGTDGVDLDGDGYPGNAPGDDPAHDCDDGDAEIHPGADDPAGDGVDQDCDGIDCVDGDGDGYCVEVDDCDDTDAEIHPGATERCNGVDDDCDGSLPVDEADADGDGFRVCDGDCDEADPLVHPDQPEVCGNFIDDDCDGTDNGCAPTGVMALDEDAALITGISALDLAGYSVAGAGDADGDGRADLLVGAPIAAQGRGQAYLVTTDVTSTMSLADARTTYTGLVVGDLAGWSVVGAGDVDGDGRDDVAIGCPGIDLVQPSPGRVYLDLAPASGSWDVDELDREFVGEVEGDQAGYALASGDTDGDGWPDLLVGAPTYGVLLEDAGSVYLVRGTTGISSLALADAIVRGESAGDRAGRAVALGDVDGDGLDDLVIGAPAAALHGPDTGAVYVLSSPISGEIYLSLAGTRLGGEASGDTAGAAVAAPGDLDGDGIGDLLVGAAFADGGGSDAGIAYLVPGPVEVSGSLGSAVALMGDATEDGAGYAVSGAGDVNGDGHIDLLVGAYHYDSGGTRTGAAYLLYGPVGGGVQDLAQADLLMVGAGDDDWTGCAVAGVGDVDLDGFGDVVIGATQESTAAMRAGAAYLVHGGGM